MYKEERLNSVSHLVGAGSALAGLAILVVLASRQGDPWKIVAFSIYGLTLFLLYVFSTLYHSLQGKPKAVFRKLDQNAVYLLIAGTYTPFMLVALRGAWGWSIFGVIWGLAAIGITLNWIPARIPSILHVIIYLLMGWLALIAIKPLFQALTLSGFLLLLLGGIFYTVGVVFYALDERVRYFHAIWHCCVLAGSLSHYLTVLFYVV
ncbi:MAG: hemolysin III family protein [Nitrospiria bacterium]